MQEKYFKRNADRPLSLSLGLNLLHSVQLIFFFICSSLSLSNSAQNNRADLWTVIRRAINGSVMMMCHSLNTLAEEACLYWPSSSGEH